MTCAGEEVHLVSWTRYSAERFGKIYGTVVRPAIAVATVEAAEPGYLDLVRSTRCDADGRFAFNGLADGAYFVQTVVSWETVSSGSQGGAVMAPVSVADGATAKVVVSP